MTVWTGEDVHLTVELELDLVERPISVKYKLAIGIEHLRTNASVEHA